MSLHGIVELLQDYPPVSRLGELCADAGVEHADVLAPLGAHPLIAALIARSTGAPLLVITTSGQGAEDFANMICDFLPEAAIATFPSWETLPHERLAPSADTIGRRPGSCGASRTPIRRTGSWVRWTSLSPPCGR